MTMMRIMGMTTIMAMTAIMTIMSITAITKITKISAIVTMMTITAITTMMAMTTIMIRQGYNKKDLSASGARLAQERDAALAEKTNIRMKCSQMQHSARKLEQQCEKLQVQRSVEG